MFYMKNVLSAVELLSVNHPRFLRQICFAAVQGQLVSGNSWLFI